MKFSFKLCVGALHLNVAFCVCRFALYSARFIVVKLMLDWMGVVITLVCGWFAIGVGESLAGKVYNRLQAEMFVSCQCFAKVVTSVV